MKKNFAIKSIAKKVQAASTKEESNNVLNFSAQTVCCDFLVGIIGNVNAQKSLVLR